jgi:hypothetical protein
MEGSGWENDKERADAAETAEGCARYLSVAAIVSCAAGCAGPAVVAASRRAFAREG